MKYRAYPKYKPSGFEWLGDVPAHWDVKRLKGSARYWVSNVDKVAAGGELPVRLCNYTDVYYHDRIYPDMGLMETTATLDEIRRFGLRVGDVVVTKDSEEWSDIAIPALVVKTSADFVCGYHLAIVRPEPKELLGPFLLRAFQACAINQQFQVAATGVTRYGLPKSSIGEAVLPVPPLEEQRAIADCLEVEMARLHTLDAKKRNLVDKLKEKRTALISWMVTRGLPPEAACAAGFDALPKRKPSGVDGLDDIPMGWRETRVWIERISRNIELQDGNHGELHPKADDYVNSGIPFVMANHIVVGRIDFENCNYIDRELANSLRIGFSQAGDVLLTHKGTIGRVGIVQENGFPYVMLTPQVTYYRCLRHVENRFLFWAFQGRYWQDQMALVSSLGTTRGYVGLLDQKRLQLIFPPVQEQRAIADYLDVEIEKIDRMVDKVQAAIERLQEYRSALITAAVTGKIDVREAATKL